MNEIAAAEAHWKEALHNVRVAQDSFGVRKAVEASLRGEPANFRPHPALVATRDAEKRAWRALKKVNPHADPRHYSILGYY